MDSAPEQKTEGCPAEEDPSGEVPELDEGNLVPCPEEPAWPDDGGPPRTDAGAGVGADIDAGVGAGVGADIDAGVNRLEILGGFILDLTGNVPGRPIPPHRSLADAMVHYYGDYVGAARRLHAAYNRKKIDNESFENTCRALQKFFLDNLRAIRIINDGPPETSPRALEADEQNYITEMCAKANSPWTEESTMGSLRKMLKDRFS